MLVDVSACVSFPPLPQPYSPMSLPPFDPADLKPIRTLHAEGRLKPFKLRYILEQCRMQRFPCVRIAGVWHSTEVHVRHYCWTHAAPDFKKTTS